jgi:hypothetical protein
MSQPLASTTIRGYLCEIEPNDDREGVNCYITKGKYSASLACAEAEGVLHYHGSGDPTADGPGLEWTITESTLEEIIAWAEANGY